MGDIAGDIDYCRLAGDVAADGDIATQFDAIGLGGALSGNHGGCKAEGGKHFHFGISN